MIKEKAIIEALPQQMNDTKSYRVTFIMVVTMTTKSAEKDLEEITSGYEEVVFK